MTKACQGCKFYRFSEDFGYCHRYPEPVGKEIDDFCGEFSSKMEILNENISYDINTSENYW